MHAKKAGKKGSFDHASDGAQDRLIEVLSTFATL